MVCKDTQAFQVPLVLEAHLVLTVCMAHEAFLVNQVPEDNQVRQEVK